MASTRCRSASGYKSDGKVVHGSPPMYADAFADVEPVYEEMPGWKESTIGVTSV